MQGEKCTWWCQTKKHSVDHSNGKVLHLKSMIIDPNLRILTYMCIYPRICGTSTNVSYDGIFTAHWPLNISWVEPQTVYQQLRAITNWFKINHCKTHRSAVCGNPTVLLKNLGLGISLTYVAKPFSFHSNRGLHGRNFLSKYFRPQITSLQWMWQCWKNITIVCDDDAHHFQ